MYTNSQTAKTECPPESERNFPYFSFLFFSRAATANTDTESDSQNSSTNNILRLSSQHDWHGLQKQKNASDVETNNFKATEAYSCVTQTL